MAVCAKIPILPLLKKLCFDKCKVVMEHMQRWKWIRNDKCLLVHKHLNFTILSFWLIENDLSWAVFSVLSFAAYGFGSDVSMSGQKQAFWHGPTVLPPRSYLKCFFSLFKEKSRLWKLQWHFSTATHLCWFFQSLIFMYDVWAWGSLCNTTQWLVRSPFMPSIFHVLICKHVHGDDERGI